MPIIIANLGGNPLGVCKYEIRINSKVIAVFEHSRPDGLASCLSRAAVAVEKAKWEEAVVFFDEALTRERKNEV